MFGSFLGTAACSKAREEPELEGIEFYGLVTEKLQDWVSHMPCFLIR